MANYFSADCGHSSWNSASPQSLLSSGDGSVVFYSPDYEQSLLDQFLPHSPSRSEFLASEGYSDPSSVSSDSSEPLASFDLTADLMEIQNGNSGPTYSPQYEQSLMDQYLPNWGANCEFSDDCRPAPSVLGQSAYDYQPAEQFETFETTQDFTEDFDAEYLDIPYESSDYSQSPSPPPAPKPAPTPRPVVREVKTQSSGVRKRGRPAGSTSNSKMAQYSKQYREAKKNEAQHLSQQIAQLEDANDRLNCENERLTREVEMLRRADSMSDKLATLLDTHRRNPGTFRLCVDYNGNPFLEVV